MHTTAHDHTLWHPQAFYYDGKPTMSDEEFENLEQELLWEGSRVAILRCTTAVTLSMMHAEAAALPLSNAGAQSFCGICAGGLLLVAEGRPYRETALLLCSSTEQKFMEASRAFAEGKPIISDEQYDELKQQLRRDRSTVVAQVQLVNAWSRLWCCALRSVCCTVCIVLVSRQCTD